eukprot:scaffold6417_cov95-Isochrysis_galbana.AAC.4
MRHFLPEGAAHLHPFQRDFESFPHRHWVVGQLARDERSVRPQPLRQCKRPRAADPVVRHVQVRQSTVDRQRLGEHPRASVGDAVEAQVELAEPAVSTKGRCKVGGEVRVGLQAH